MPGESRFPAGQHCDACGAPVSAAPEAAVGVRIAIRCDGCLRALDPPIAATVPPAGIPGPQLLTRGGQRVWMESLGQHIRRTREFLRMTQGQLATAAGTSQAAISRLEQGGALGTPYLVVLAVQRALRDAFRQVSRDVRPHAMAPYVDHPTMLPETQSTSPTTGIETDQEWLRYVQAYRMAPEAVRSHLVVVVEAVASAVPSHCS